jgi:Transposase DDE domain group 1
VVESTRGRTGTPAGVRTSDPGWAKGLRVQVAGSGVVAHAGVVVPRLLADRVGLTDQLRQVLARAGFAPGRDRGQVLVDGMCALAAGATCASDVEALTRAQEIFGPGGGASDTTFGRVLGEFASCLDGDGLPARRLAKALAQVRARAWSWIVAGNDGLLPPVRVGGAPLVRPGTGDSPALAITVVRVDATVIDAAALKPGVSPHYKHGIGYHPLSAWCTNIGDALAVMQRTGNAGSFTGIDHVKVLEHALAQIPPGHRRDVLVTIDGAGASHEVIDHLTARNTARRPDASYDRRGRRIEYSTGWPVDARTRSGIERLREQDWGPALHADGRLDPGAQVAELTGILRTGIGGDELEGWPADLRVIARRTPRQPGEQAELGQDAHWRYGAFATNTATGQVQFLDVRHRSQAHVEDKMKEWKATGAEKLPAIGADRAAAWLHLAALTVTLTAWCRHLALDGPLAGAEPKALRYRLWSAPARLVTHAGHRILKISPTWPWAADLARAFTRVQALHPA